MPKVPQSGKDFSKNPHIEERKVETKPPKEEHPLIHANPTEQIIKIPDYLTKGTMPEQVPGMQTGFVGFGSSQSNNWNMLQLSGVEEGRPYIARNNEIIPLKELHFFLLMAESYITEMVGKEGKFTYVEKYTPSVEIEEESEASFDNRSPHYVGLMLVYAHNKLIPIKGDLRGTKANGLAGAIQAVKVAATPDWLTKSEAHKVTAVFPQPFGRVFHRITTQYRVSKKTGNPYWRAQCVSMPTPIGLIELLANSFNDRKFNQDLEEARRNYVARLEYLDNLEKTLAQSPSQG